MASDSVFSCVQVVVGGRISCMALRCLLTVDGWTEAPLDVLRSEAGVELDVPASKLAVLFI